jgi:uncharacterized protein involved in type VI secretion and phage assembly
MTSLIDMLHGASREDGRVFGVVSGRVTDNRDPEGLGRVKVTFPWLGDESGTWWARIAAPAGGRGRGAWFLPEVDDEVLVAFEHGDPRFPYVLGALWNQDAAPPEDVEKGGADHRSITSRSGHVLRLDDTDSEEKIEIVDKTGKNRIVITSSDNGLKISAEGDIVIASTGGNVAIEGADVKISAKGTATVKAAGKLELSANGQTTVKGAMVAIN